MVEIEFPAHRLISPQDQLAVRHRTKVIRLEFFPRTRRTEHSTDSIGTVVTVLSSA